MEWQVACRGFANPLIDSITTQGMRDSFAKCKVDYDPGRIMLDADVLSHWLHYKQEFIAQPPLEVLNIIICIRSQTDQCLSA